jgi:hypothetical protein
MARATRSTSRPSTSPCYAGRDKIVLHVHVGVEVAAGPLQEEGQGAGELIFQVGGGEAGEIGGEQAVFRPQHHRVAGIIAQQGHRVAVLAVDADDPDLRVHRPVGAATVPILAPDHLHAAVGLDQPAVEAQVHRAPAHRQAHRLERGQGLGDAGADPFLDPAQIGIALGPAPVLAVGLGQVDHHGAAMGVAGGQQQAIHPQRARHGGQAPRIEADQIQGHQGDACMAVIQDQHAGEEWIVSTR